jgi:DNA gyrase subunit B
VLEGLEAVRKRPAMYIGSTGPAGLHHLVYEVVDNSIDEALAGYCDQVNVTIHSTTRSRSSTTAAASRPTCTERALGGGSRADRPARRRQVRERRYKVSGGLHGVGVSVVNALSEWLGSRSGATAKCTSRRSNAARPSPGSCSRARPKRRGTKVTFKPDDQIFETTEYSFDILAQRLRELAFLNAGVVITLEDERGDGKTPTASLRRRHQREFVEYLNKNKTNVHDDARLHAGRDGTASSSRSRCSGTTRTTPRRFYSFANNINTHEGGTHLSGFRPR